MPAKIVYIGDDGKEYPIKATFYGDKDAYASLRDESLFEAEREHGPGPVIVAVRVELCRPIQLRDVSDW